MCLHTLSICIERLQVAGKIWANIQVLKSATFIRYVEKMNTLGGLLLVFSFSGERHLSGAGRDLSSPGRADLHLNG